MNAWPLPPAQSSDYQYEIYSGLVRTPFVAAHPRQMRKTRTNRHTFILSWLVTQAELKTAKAFLQTYGFTWFTMPLLSGRTATPIDTLIVRVIADDKVEALGWDTYKLSLQVEEKVAGALSLEGTIYNEVPTPYYYPQDGCQSCTIVPVTVGPVSASFRDCRAKTLWYPNTALTMGSISTGDESAMLWGWAWLSSGMRIQAADAGEEFDIPYNFLGINFAPSFVDMVLNVPFPIAKLLC
jgi:hypothetical protein